MLLPKAASSHRHIFEMGFELEQVRKYIREQEAARSSYGPIVDRASRRASVERRVHFDRRKLRGVVGKEGREDFTACLSFDAETHTS